MHAPLSTRSLHLGGGALYIICRCTRELVCIKFDAGYSARPQCAVALMAGKMSKRVQCSAATAAASEIYDRISGSDHLFPRRRLLRWTRRASASMMGKWHPLFLYTPMVLMMMPGARILIKKRIFENALLHHDCDADAPCCPNK